MEKSREQLQIELEMEKRLELHRKDSDGKYAMKLVERVVWSLLATMFLFLAGWYFTHLQESNKPTSNVKQLILPTSND